MATNLIDCSFSLLNEGRKYSGQHRKYVIENAREICYAPATRERIKLREALGYYGHGRRVLCRKMNIQEVDVMTLPDGTQAMVSNVPSNVTVAFDVDQDGTVKHTQEILETETGKIVSGLHASRVGGFSWACPGDDKGSLGTTKLTGFSGFDFVLQPGFATNRGYVLESATGAAEQQVLESVSAIIGDDKKAEQLVAGWRLSSLQQVEDLEDMVFESESRYFDLKAQYDAAQQEAMQLVSDRDSALTQAEALHSRFKGVLEGICGALPFFIPEDAMHSMLEGDFERAKHVFESAAHFDFTQYPLRSAQGRQHAVTDVAQQSEEPEYGTAGYGFAMKL